MAFKNYKQCTATAKRSGERCINPAMKGKNVCYHHGGKTPSGTASPNYKHGRYSKDLPDNLSQHWREAITDDELLSVRDDIRLIDAITLSLLPDLDTGNSQEAWKIISRTIPKLERAYQEVDTIGMAEGLRTLRALTRQQLAKYATQTAIKENLEQRRKLVETEQKIALAGERAISIEQFMLLMGAIFRTIETIVKSQDERVAIAREIRNVLEISN